MNLKDFVKESILQIGDGINAAIEEADASGVLVNPGTTIEARSCVIRFSVNVETEKEGGMSLQVLGGTVSKVTSNRLEFGIKVAYPGMTGQDEWKPTRKKVQKE